MRNWPLRFFPSSNEDFCKQDYLMLFGMPGEAMRAGHYRGFKEGLRAREFRGNCSGFSVTHSDSIVGDSRVPFIPFREERRQKEHAAQSSTQIPCSLRTQSTTYFSFWIQPVAAFNEYRLRQSVSYHARPEKAGEEMARNCQAPFPFHDLSRGPQIQGAAAMANPEVSQCR